MNTNIITAVVLAIGFVLSANILGTALEASRQTDRYVTVKGVAEREVVADKAFWSLRFVATGNDLPATQAQIQRDADTVQAFLSEQEIDPASIKLAGLEVTDLLAERYRSGPVDSRYVINQTLMIESGDVEIVYQASQQIGQLVDRGVVLSAEGGYQRGPIYVFSKLDEHKPSMIAEATKKAREAAEQFAQDSNSRIGRIRRANQGVFQILPRNIAPGLQQEQQIDKRLRVVSTIEYQLAN